MNSFIEELKNIDWETGNIIEKSLKNTLTELLKNYNLMDFVYGVESKDFSTLKNALLQNNKIDGETIRAAIFVSSLMSTLQDCERKVKKDLEHYLSVESQLNLDVDRFYDILKNASKCHPFISLFKHNDPENPLKKTYEVQKECLEIAKDYTIFPRERQEKIKKLIKTIECG